MATTLLSSAPRAGKVFIVSAVLHRKGLSCPACGRCAATITKQQVSISEPFDGAV